MSRRFSVLVAAALGVSLLGAGQAAATESGRAFPTEFALPNGFMPEGIAIGDGPTAYFGSRADGSLFRVNLRTGKGEVFSKGPGTPSTGLKVDSRHRLFVSGASGGDARVVDARSGKVLASYKFAATDTFVNDVIVTDQAAWFTDSRKPLLYKVALGRHGSLPSTFETLTLTGDMVFTPGVTNANGIATTPDGRALLIVQSNTGKLFRVDPRTGVTKEVNLGGEVLTAGDGLLREGNSLFVVQNRLNTVAKFRLDRTATTGTLVAKATDPRFDVPTTVASFGHRLYLPNARFSTPPTPDTPYNVIAIPRP
ncbi:superoxide dismutase [Actinocrispum sp. NPDC049592]|uniref:SMP-30/gluconolactonase/LRE family protein n=1 Tax=Actinocrispum sp. NPDC049592 TaxID=3154835 RepID=UPI0034278DE0